MPATATDRLAGITTSLAVKPPCVAVTSFDIPLAGLFTVGSVVLEEGDRVLVRAQTDARQNGIYNASTSDWTRALDFDGSRDVVTGTMVLVRNSVADGALYEVTTSGEIIIGQSQIIFDVRDDPTILYAQTQAELDALVLPVNTHFTTEGMITPFRFGAVGDGVTDDSTALQEWLAVLGQNSQRAFGFWGRGTFKCSTSLVVPANVFLLGAGNQATILKPTAAVTSYALTTSAGTKLHGFMIDGSATTNAFGLLVGPVGPDYNELQDIWVQNFAGGRGTGIRVAECVSLIALRVFSVGCNTNLRIESNNPGSLPTTCLFQSCRFSSAVVGDSSLTGSGKGVIIRSGQQITFRDCILEANAQEGMYVLGVVGASTLIQDLSIEDTWFEDNWHGHIDTGTNVYSLRIDGSSGLGANASLCNVHLVQGTELSDRKSILLAACQAVLEKVRCYYLFANDIVVAGSNCLVYVKDDAYDRCGRCISNPANNGNLVSYPPYLPIIDLGNGHSVLPTIEKLVALTYSASMTPDLQNGNSFNIQVSNTTAFTINNPSNVGGIQSGKRMSIRLNNVSGNNTLGAVTWGSAYKSSFATGASAPANNFSILIEFEWDGTHMVECYHSPAGVPV